MHSAEQLRARQHDLPPLFAEAVRHKQGQIVEEFGVKDGGIAASRTRAAQKRLEQFVVFRA